MKSIRGVLVLIIFVSMIFMFTGAVSATDTTPPTVWTVDPVNNSVNIAGNKVIKVSFSEAIRNGTCFTELKGNDNSTISTTNTIGTQVLTITPNSNLNHGVVYNLTLHTGSYTDLAGNPNALYSTIFTVDSTPPTVWTVDPLNNSVNIAGNKAISVSFSEAIRNGTCFTELKGNDNSTISTTNTIGTQVLTITPNSNLNHGVVYNLTLHTGSYTDLAGNPNALYSTIFTVDSTPPTVSSVDPLNNSVNIAGNKVISISFSEPIQKGTDYTELKGNNNTISTINTINGNVLTITPNSNLNHGVVYNLTLHTGSYTDLTGNPNALYSTIFTVDSTPPTVSSFDPAPGAVSVAGNKVISVSFSEPMQVGSGWTELKGNDNSTISTTNTINGNILTITPNNNLNYGILYTLTLHAGSYTDLAGNNLANYTTSFTVNNLILDINTNKTYFTIQAAINDQSTLSGDVIELMSGTYTENIVVNKTLTLMPVSGGNVTIQPLNSSNPVFTVNSLGNGTIIQGFTIIGATNSNGIFLNGSSNCNVTGNNLTNNYAAIRILNSNNIVIQNNTISNNSWYGAYLTYSNNIMIMGNTISGSVYGINPQSSSATVQFNRINGCSSWGLVSQGNSTVTAINNWWGSNNPQVTMNNITNTDICVQDSSIVTYNPWLILNLTASPTSNIGNYSITADLTHNSNGNDTSPSGNVPDGIPVNFTTTSGTIGPIAYTSKGKAVSTLNFPTPGTANVNMTLDKQNILTVVNFGVYDVTSQTEFGSIQAAISDSSTLPGDVIVISNGTYTENIVINKTLTLMPVTGGNVTILALNPSNPVITVNSLGNGTVIQGFNIVGATNSNGIFLNGSSNCNVTGNNLTNNYAAIRILSSNNIAIQNNIISNNSWYGAYLTYSNNIIITGNTITNSVYGINPQSSSTTVQFNRITGCSSWGLVSQGNSTVIAINNWWGSNNPQVTMNNITNTDICVQDTSIVTYNPWLILNLTASPTSNIGNYSITADLTHNSNGNDTSPLGNVPDGIPVNFTTTSGTIGPIAYTSKGKAVSILNFTTRSAANVNITLDHQNISKIFNFGVYDVTSQTNFSSIQAAISDSSTSPGDIIEITNGTYNENIVINKSVNIGPVIGTNPLLIGSVTINSGGNGSTIQGLTINGNINLYANNCTIFGNTIIGNGTSGIIASNSFNNTISSNTINSIGSYGIQSNSSTNTIQDNTIYGCVSGIYSEYSNDNITSNYLFNNLYGIWTYNSTDTIEFNRITNNTCGLRNDIGIINATNNWWGSNNNPNSPSDIWIVSGNVIYNPWLVLSVNASSTNSGGNTSVTADLTHNSQGVDTSSQGFVPDGIPVNFTSSSGTIVNTAYTFEGKAVTILDLNSTQPQNVTVSASVDNQFVSTSGFITTGVAVLNIISTAIDNSTSLPLNITYNIPLNNSVNWVSVIWIPTVIPNNNAKADELQLIVNGIIVQDVFIYCNNTLNTDALTFNLAYPGITGLNMTVVDPVTNHTTNLNFPGNNVNRTSQIIYNGTPYEGVLSFAIATTDVTPDILNYWLGQSSLYQSSTMNATYASFITALLVEYAHDQLADNISSKCNVTWSRTSPIIVSVCDEAYESYLTLECDHSMGMTVVGTPGNIWTFNYITSFSISPIEYAILNTVTGNNYQSASLDGYFSSVTTDLINDYLANNTSVEEFMQNGYIIEKSVNNDNEFLVIDPETGIVRDINTMNNFCGLSTAPYNDCLYNVFLTSAKLFAWQLNPWDYGSVPINWDGRGEVYIGSHPYADPSTDQIYSWGKLIFTTNKGSITFNPDDTGADPFIGGDVNITGILDPNTVTEVSIESSVTNPQDVWIGCSTLAINQVSYTMPPYKYFSNWQGLISDLISGKKEINKDYFSQWGEVASGYINLNIEIGSLAVPELLPFDIEMLSRAETANSLFEHGNNFQESVTKANNTPLFK